MRATFDLGNGSEALIGSQLAGQLHLLTDGRPVKASAGGDWSARPTPARTRAAQFSQ